MLPKPERRVPSYRWTLALGLVLVAGLAVAFAVARSRWRSQRTGEPAEAVDTDEYLRPIETTAGAGGEQVAPFAGFAVSVETEPEAALVTVAGVERGEAPVLAGVTCSPGAKVAIRAQKAGYRPVQATTICRRDALVKLTLRLAP